MKYLICGASLVSGNGGVNALTRSTIEGLLDINVSNEISILSYTCSKEIKHQFLRNDKIINVIEYPLDLSMKKILVDRHLMKFGLGKKLKKSSIFKLLTESDYILDISEGDSFSDIYGLKRFLQHSVFKELAIILDKKLIIMPQTIGPFKNKMVLKAAQKILRDAYKVYTRDNLSYNLAINNLGVSKNKITQMPDLAFYMNSNNNFNFKKYLKFENDSKKIIGVNVSGLLYNGGYTGKNMFDLKCEYKELVLNVIEKLLIETSSNILLIPHVITKEWIVEDDVLAGKSIYEILNKKYPNRISYIEEHLREDQLKYLISNCEFFIGSRMHACIAASSTNVPTMPIAYSRKFIGIWKELSLDWCVADPREETIEEILIKVKNVYERKIEVMETLKKQNKLFKIQLEKLFSEL